MEPFEQLQSWIDQQSNADPDQLKQRLAEWSTLLSSAQKSAQALNANHSELIAQLCQQNQGLIQLLQTLSDKSGADPKDQLQLLRRELYQLNLEFLLKTAELPEQFLPLVFTQMLTKGGFTSAQLDALQSSIDQINAPQFKSLKLLLLSFIAWSTNADRMFAQLNKVSDVAIEDWLESIETNKSSDERIALWVAAYDSAFQRAYQQPEMQLAQGELINSLSQVKLCWQQLIEQLAAPLGLPTGSQIDQLISALDQQRRRIRTLEREVAQLKSALNTSGQ